MIHTLCDLGLTLVVCFVLLRPYLHRCPVVQPVVLPPPVSLDTRDLPPNHRPGRQLLRARLEMRYK